LNHEGAPVKLVGAGRDEDYGHLGFSHWAVDDEAALAAFPNIVIYKPNTKEELISIWDEFLYNNQPCYLNIRRTV
jgi:transketolase C-terminal domain/subunit